MFEDIKRFFTESAYFHSCLAAVSGNAKLRGVLLALALGIAGGQIPLGPLGPYLYWIVPIIGLASGAIAHGDKNPPEITALTAQIQEKAPGAALVVPPVAP